MSDDQPMKTGSCLCGSVSYRIKGPLRPVIACHCVQCQKTSGHMVMATACQLDQMEFIADHGLKWFASTDFAERGFCQNCGGNLFYRRNGSDQISVMAGTLDQPSGLQVAEHIYVAEKGDYYDIGDDVPLHPGDTPDRQGNRR